MTYAEKLGRLLELAISRGDRASMTMLRVRIEAEVAAAIKAARKAA